ncbi:MAG: transporter [Ignavibacteriales bacterium]|nr:transporter [Ignavibacteriales bacterium]
MKRVVRALLISFFSLHMVFAQRPVMRAESAVTLGKGKVQAGAGVEYFRKNIPPPPEFPQSVWRVFVLAWHQGVAENVNLDLDWLGGLSAKTPAGSRYFDWGDLTVSTRINFFREQESFPAVGIQNSVKLPNTSYHRTRLGSNQMDFHTHLLLSKQFPSLETRLNVSFSIVGNPEVVGVQDDVYGFDAGLITPISENFKFFAEMVGFTGYEDHNSKLVGRYGFLYGLEDYQWSVHGSLRAAGDNYDYGNSFEGSENWSIGLTLVRAFNMSFLE